MIELSVIIVSYNVKPYLEQAIFSIRKALKNIHAEIFVVDNGSGDGSVQMVQKRFPEIRRIVNSQNIGFARANNQAIRKASGKMICLVNPDTLIREDTFRICLNFLKTHPKAGAVGCKILNPDGSLQLACRRSFPTPWVAFTKVTGLARMFPYSRWFGQYNLTYLDSSHITEVDAISGSFMFLRKETIDDVGLLDERFFMYGEDLDWCYRIREKGWKIFYCPETEIIHYKGRSTEEASFDSIRMFYGAMLLFVKKHFGKGWYFLPKWFLILGIWIKGGFSILKKLIHKLVVPVIDLGCLQLGLMLSISIRFGSLYHWRSYLTVNFVYAFVWILCFSLIGLYNRRIFSVSRALGGVFVGLIINTSLTFFFPQYAFSRQVVLMTGCFNGLLLGGWRLLVKLASRSRQIPFLGTIGRTLLRKKALLIGRDQSDLKIAACLQNQIDGNYEIVGFLCLNEDELIVLNRSSIPVLGTIKDLERIVIAHHVRDVIFSTRSLNTQKILAVIQISKDLHLEFKMVPEELDVLIGSTLIEQLDSMPMLNLDYKIFLGMNIFLKRLMDIVISFLLLPAWMFSYVYMMLHPKYSFGQNEVSDGYGKSIKIQTVLNHRKERKGRLFTCLLVPKVLSGKLSLVGTELIPFSKSENGLGFKPGLTGLVQINTKHCLSSEDKVKYRLYYFKNYTLLLDMEIMFRSLFHR